MRAAATAALVLLAAQSALPQAALAQPKVLRYTPAADLTSLDAQTNTSLVTAEYGMMVYDTLFALDVRMAPRPQMVESHEVSADGLVYTFKLRPGLKFHDGQPVTSADVVPSIRRFIKRDALGRRMEAQLASFEADGDSGFRITFRARFIVRPVRRVEARCPNSFGEYSGWRSIQRS